MLQEGVVLKATSQDNHKSQEVFSYLTLRILQSVFIPKDDDACFVFCFLFSMSQYTNLNSGFVLT